MSKLGLIQVYTGDGKGKTTASLGLAFRALGRNFPIYMIQFLKSGETGELRTIQRYLPNIRVVQYGVEALNDEQSRMWEFGKDIELEKIDKKGRFRFLPDEEEKEACRRAFEHAKKIINSNDYGIVILDEINCALSKGLIDTKEVIEFLKNKPKEVEVVLTGRGAPKELIELADLVTEMKRIKHPYDKGIYAREGIEY